MRWTRHPLVRAAALGAAAYLVVTRATRLDGWFWIGVLFVVLNVVGLVAQQRSARRGEEPTSSAVARERLQDGDEDEVRLADLLGDPAVASAWATAPAQWQQVSHLDDPSGPVGPMPAVELAAFVWLLRDRLEWQIALGEELKPYLDLDAPEDQDPILRVLRAHPAVEEAWHEDREVYVVQPVREMALDRLARLAAHALAAGQVEAAARRG